MRKALESIDKKIELNRIGEQTNWKQGYEAGLLYAKKMVEDGIEDLIVPNNNYFVIMYFNGDKHNPYIEELRLYKIDIKKRKRYLFSRNLNATWFNTKTPDLVISNSEMLRKRVFFLKEDAEMAI